MLAWLTLRFAIPRPPRTHACVRPCMLVSLMLFFANGGAPPAPSPPASFKPKMLAWLMCMFANEEPAHDLVGFASWRSSGSCNIRQRARKTGRVSSTAIQSNLGLVPLTRFSDKYLRPRGLLSEETRRCEVADDCSLARVRSAMACALAGSFRACEMKKASSLAVYRGVGFSVVPSLIGSSGLQRH